MDSAAPLRSQGIHRLSSRLQAVSRRWEATRLEPDENTREVAASLVGASP